MISWAEDYASLASNVADKPNKKSATNDTHSSLFLTKRQIHTRINDQRPVVDLVLLCKVNNFCRNVQMVTI